MTELSSYPVYPDDIDENIDATQSLDGAPNDGATMGGITDVACDEHGLAFLLFDLFLNFIGVIMLAQIRTSASSLG
jgi:hypothetical protein